MLTILDYKLDYSAALANELTVSLSLNGSGNMPREDSLLFVFTVLNVCLGMLFSYRLPASIMERATYSQEAQFKGQTG